MTKRIFLAVAVGISLLFVVILLSSHLLIAVVPLVAVALVWYATKTPRKLLKTQLTPLHQISEGVVKVQGTVSAPTIFTTPYFKQECIAYHYKKANITYDSETGSENENEVITEEEFQDFYLTNATGKVKVVAEKLNLGFLSAKSDTIHSIKYAVDDVRHTERTLQNGDLINVMAYAKRNAHYEFELVETAKQPLVISNHSFENESRKSFKTFKYILPYAALMYVLVNYFIFFAPVKAHLAQNTAFVLFAFFGAPILGLILAVVGRKAEGFLDAFLSTLGGILLMVTLIAFPLLCLLLMTKTAFYTIVCVWLSVFVCVSLCMGINYKKLVKLNQQS